MTPSEWTEVKIGDVLFLEKNPQVVLTVEEICVEDRFLQNWINRGHTNVTHLIKLTGENGFHTWSVEPAKWLKQ